MKILHVLNHIRQTGNGIVNVAVDLACLQAEQKHEVYVASAGGTYECLLSDYQVKHIQLNQSRTVGNMMTAVQNYVSLIKEIQPDIVHAHMITGLLLVCFLKGYGHYCTVATVHNEFQRSSILMGLADRVIAVSDAVADSMQRRGIPSQKLHVVRNGTLGSPRTKAIYEYPAANIHKPAILTVAGMYERKGIAELIHAFVRIAPKHPETHLYLVGNGPDREKYEALAHSTSVEDRIHFEGFQVEPQRYLLAADIFVLASHREPFGLVLAEAREAGCAIIASNVGGIPEALDSGDAGLLIAPRSSTELAVAIDKLLDDPNVLSSLKVRAIQNLDWLKARRVADDTLKIYAECGS